MPTQPPSDDSRKLVLVTGGNDDMVKVSGSVPRAVSALTFSGEGLGSATTEL